MTEKTFTDEIRADFAKLSTPMLVAIHNIETMGASTTQVRDEWQSAILPATDELLRNRGVDVWSGKLLTKDDEVCPDCRHPMGHHDSPSGCNHWMHVFKDTPFCSCSRRAS